MHERQYDKILGIRTVGLREWKDSASLYNRYEATPYKALDQLFNAYKLREGDQVVDFGSGRGRIAFYINNKFQVPVTGIEANDITFGEALDNKERYRRKAKHIKAPINFEFGLAEHYEIKPEENKFYFFNPFSVKIFRQVINNIIKSVEENKRVVDIIIYYPLPEYKQFLRNKTPFQLINKVRVSGRKDKLEKFVIYRMRPEEDEE